MDAIATDLTTNVSNIGDSGTGESSDEATLTKKPRFSASLNNLMTPQSECSVKTEAGHYDEESDEDIITGEYALPASTVRSARAMKATHDYGYTNTSNTTSFTSNTTSFASSGSSKEQQEIERTKDLPDLSFTTSSYSTKTDRDERQMEANRVRARDIRKRKKTMVEEMQRKIVGLTMANQHLIRQTQMQNAEIHLLRSTQGLIPNHSVSIAC